MLVAILFSLCASEAVIVNNHIERRYQIEDNLITVSLTAEITNQGDKSTNEYYFAVTHREGQFIGHTTASLVKKDARNFENSLPITRFGDEFKVDLKRQIDPGDTVTVYFTYTLGDYFLFLKKNIKLNQKIGLYFNTSKFYFSPRYKTLTSSLEVNGIMKSQIQTHTADDNLKITSSSLSLPQLTNNDGSVFEIEFTTSKSLPRINLLNARTEVSHWGKTKQSLYYDITNAGPKFVGEFNRIDFTTQSPCYIQQLQITPPEGASDFWGSDEAGLLEKELHYSNGQLEIPLRGPMLSSWGATFSTGWTINTDKFVSGHFHFNAPLLNPFIPAPLTEATHEIVLPEGAKVTKVSVPIDANVTQFTEVHNLDLNGRTVIRIEVQNISSEDVVPIDIEYRLFFYNNYLKIALLTFAFSVLFCGIIIFRRIDCGISVAPNVENENASEKPKTD